MSAYFVFVRFFPGYPGFFPFDRFAHLRDQDIAAAAEDLRLEWWRNPKNRRAFQKKELETRKSLEERRTEWQASVLARPGTNQLKPVSGATVDPDQAKRARTEIPSLEEIPFVAGWGQPMSSKALLYGISRWQPVAHFDTKDTAEVATAALQEKNG
jgi:hypothetical protein